MKKQKIQIFQISLEEIAMMDTHYPSDFSTVDPWIEIKLGSDKSFKEVVAMVKAIVPDDGSFHFFTIDNEVVQNSLGDSRCGRKTAKLLNASGHYLNGTPLKNRNTGSGAISDYWLVTNITYEHGSCI